MKPFKFMALDYLKNGPFACFIYALATSLRQLCVSRRPKPTLISFYSYFTALMNPQPVLLATMQQSSIA